AIQLDYLPRMDVHQTSAQQMGQIYLPGANWLLLLVIVAVVAGFGSSANLASAYGVAVTGTMLVTTILTFFLIRYGWGYPLWACIAATGFFVLVDLAFFSSSLLKIADGGWFPLALGALVFIVMTTWRRGRVLAAAAQRRQSIPLESFVTSLGIQPPHRVPGTAVFMAGDPDGVPNSMLHNLKHNKVLHERVVFLTVTVRDVPWVPAAERVAVDALGQGFYRMRVSFGFMDRPDVAASLELAAARGLAFDPMQTTFFLSRATVLPAGLQSADGMAQWRDSLFATMARNARTAADYYNIPPNCVIELGTKIVI
ncbi:MAG TPA: KUP/HAK/KT family potassium transporter, partial [Burkholderiales bacterium]